MNPFQQTKALVQKVFGTRFSRELKRIQPLVREVHEHERRLKALSDAQIQEQTAKFRGILTARHGPLQAEVDRLKKAKHDCPDVEEGLALDRDLAKAEERYKAALGDALMAILPEAFATIREACRRLQGSVVDVTGHELTWDMVPYD